MRLSKPSENVDTQVFAKTFFQLLLISGGVSFSLLALEFALKVFYSGWSNGHFQIVEEYDSPFIVRRRGGTRIFAGQPGGQPGGQPAIVNEQGMRRTTDVTDEPREGVVRILSYGDSIGFGLWVSDTEHFPHVLEELLNQSEPGRYEVFNMLGGDGLSPTINALRLKRDIGQFKPKLVLMEVELLNDISDEAFIRYEGRDKFGFPEKITSARYIMSWDKRILGLLPPIPHYVRRTYLYSKLSYILGNGQSEKSPNPVFLEESNKYYYHRGYDRHFLTEARLQKGFENMFKSIQAARSYSSEMGVRFRLLLHPSRYAFMPNSQYSTHAIAIFQAAEQKAVELGIPYISLYPALKEQGGEKLYFDFCHPTVEGYRVVAGEIFQSIQSSLQL